MSHTTVVYPNGMVEVVFDDEDAELGCCGVEDTETEPVSDALDVLDEHFANHGGIRVHLQVIRAVHNRQVWGADVTCKAADPGV